MSDKVHSNSSKTAMKEMKEDSRLAEMNALVFLSLKQKGRGEKYEGSTFNKYKQFIENCFAAMPRQALHAKSLGFQHPTTGEQVYFESELPEDFRTVLAKWDAYAAAGLAEE